MKKKLIINRKITLSILKDLVWFDVELFRILCEYEIKYKKKFKKR